MSIPFGSASMRLVLTDTPEGGATHLITSFVNDTRIQEQLGFKTITIAQCALAMDVGEGMGMAHKFENVVLFTKTNQVMVTSPSIIFNSYRGPRKYKVRFYYGPDKALKHFQTALNEMVATALDKLAQSDTIRLNEKDINPHIGKTTARQLWLKARGLSLPNPSGVRTSKAFGQQAEEESESLAEQQG